MQNQEDSRSTDIHYYEDIIDLPHYFPQDRIRMPRSKRAAQFMAFKPFPGYDTLIDRVEYEYIRDNYPDKQWKNTSTIYKNLSILNRICKCKLDDEVIWKIANSRLGWYKRCSMDGINYLLNPKILSRKTKSRPGLVDPLNYYLGNLQRI